MRPSEKAAMALVQTYGAEAPAVVASYHQAFPEGSRALKDLEVYAGIWRPAPYGDEGQRMEGRREVFLWVRTILGLTQEDVRKFLNTNDGEDYDAR